MSIVNFRQMVLVSSRGSREKRYGGMEGVGVRMGMGIII